VLVYDPTRVTRESPARWTPLAQCDRWLGAQRTASWLCGAAAPARGGLASAEFWYAAAAKLLAPMLFAAATQHRGMRDVVRWVDTQERDEVDDALALAEVPEAQAAMTASWQREEKQRSSIYTTAETVLAAYADPNVAASADECDLDFPRFLDGGEHTIYVCAPGHEQRRLQALFSTLLQQLMMAAYEKAVVQGEPLDPPMLLLVDEAANIAPLPNLDQVASTAASHGIALVSIFQDFSQIAARYGRDRANTIANNHRAKLVGSGISDPMTLDYVSQLLGDEQVRELSETHSEGGRALTHHTTMRRLAPTNLLRQTRPGEMVLVYAHLPPVRVRLRPWFEDRRLRRVAAA
jgi:type IV secretion system protein VirD4